MQVQKEICAAFGWVKTMETHMYFPRNIDIIGEFDPNLMFWSKIFSLINVKHIKYPWKSSIWVGPDQDWVELVYLILLDVDGWI